MENPQETLYFYEKWALCNMKEIINKTIDPQLKIKYEQIAAYNSEFCDKLKVGEENKKTNKENQMLLWALLLQRSVYFYAAPLLVQDFSIEGLGEIIDKHATICKELFTELKFREGK